VIEMSVPVAAALMTRRIFLDFGDLGLCSFPSAACDSGTPKEDASRIAISVED